MTKLAARAIYIAGRAVSPVATRRDTTEADDSQPSYVSRPAHSWSLRWLFRALALYLTFMNGRTIRFYVVFSLWIAAILAFASYFIIGLDPWIVVPAWMTILLLPLWFQDGT